MTPLNPHDLPIVIDDGLADWQILQRDATGSAHITLRGRWATIIKRKQPEVRVRIVREGTYTPISRQHDWIPADTLVDASVTGPMTGKSGSWSLKLPPIPRGGPYRLETVIGSHEDAIEWRRAGQQIDFFGVGDVWLIAGQSNAEGYALSPVDDPAELGVHQFDPRRGWQLATHGTRHHPWLAFCKTLKKQLAHPIGFIPTAVGGSAIARWDPTTGGDLYQIMAERFARSGGSVKGILWYQGESDVGPENRDAYADRFTRYASGVRQLTANPQLPIITVQLNRLLTHENGEGWEFIRETQRQLSHTVPHVFLISIFEATLSDLIHTSSLGNLLIAQRAADTALGGVYGRDIAFRHPECSRVNRLSDDAVELHFDHVIQRLEYISKPGSEFAFAVRDEQGDVPVSAFKLTGRDVLRLELARPLQGHATVTGAPGSRPPHVVPYDIAGYRSMLGFTLPVQAE